MPPALHSYGPLESVTSAPRVVVLRGRDPRSGRAVSIKIVGTLEESRPRSERVVDRVFNALTGLKSAGHPSVPRILEVGRIGGGAVFLVSEWVEGHVLSAPLEVPPQTVLNYATQVVSVLESMARYGLAHLNLRPNNLMIDATGRVQLLGLASGYLVDSGSLQRSAPELSTQLASGGALWRCDLYSLASTTCQLLGAKVEGAGTPVPFVGFPEEVRRELRGSEGLRLVLESALHRAATRRPASLGVFRRALLNCLDDAEENRPIPLQPLPVEYRSETGTVRVKGSAPVLLFEAEGEEPQQAPANEAAEEPEELAVEAVAESAESQAVTATFKAPVDVDADLAEYVALGASTSVQQPAPGAAVPGSLRLVATEPVKPRDVLVAKAGAGELEEPVGADSSNEEALAAPEETKVDEPESEEELDTSREFSGSQASAGASQASAGASQASAGAVAEATSEEDGASEEPVDAKPERNEDSAFVDADVSALRVGSRPAPTPEESEPAGEIGLEPQASSAADSEKEIPMSIEETATENGGDVSKEFVLGRDLVPEELLDGAAAAAEAAMPDVQQDDQEDPLLTASIELDEGTAIGADSGMLHLDEVATATAPDSVTESESAVDSLESDTEDTEPVEEPRSFEDLATVERISVGDVPSAEDLFEEHQPEAAEGADLRKTVPLELVQSELENEFESAEVDETAEMAEADETLEQVLSGAALARADEDEPYRVDSSEEHEGSHSESFVEGDGVDVSPLSTGDLEEWSDSVEAAETAVPAAAFAGATAKKKSSGLLSANSIRGLFVVAAILWATFAVLWFRQEDRLAVGVSETPEVAAAQPAVASEVATESPAEVAEPGASSPQAEVELEQPVPADTAPVTELEPAPLVASASEKVEDSVRQWAAAWSRQDVNGYLAAYSQAFRPANGASRAQWASYRRDRVSAPSSVSVTLDDLEVVVDGARATAVFRQTYRSDTMSDQVIKTLTLGSEGDEWKILEEVSRPVG